MTSCEPAIRRCMSSESAVGTMRSLSPLAMSVGWVILDRSAGVERPHRLIALSWVRKALMVIFASLSSVRSSRRSTNARAARLPMSSRLKNRNSLGSFRVRVARSVS